METNGQAESDSDSSQRDIDDKDKSKVRFNEVVGDDKPRPISGTNMLKHKTARSSPSKTRSIDNGHNEIGLVGVLRDLDDAYCTVSDEHNCNIIARRKFARQAALYSVTINMTFLICGALFFANQTDWAPIDVALFTVYTVTSAGYGHVEIPETALFRIVNTFYILIGLSLMAIMVAQLYQFFALEAKSMQHTSDQAEVLQQGLKKLKNEPPSATRTASLAKLKKSSNQRVGFFDKVLVVLTRMVVFSVENPWGDLLYRVSGLAMLAGSGALVVGIIEGWNWYTAIYWSIVSLTTVGYGDVVPQTIAGKAFTTAWLPLNLFFLSILFSSVGHYYLQFCDKQIARIQQSIQDKGIILRAKNSAQRSSLHRSSSIPSIPDDDVEAAAAVGTNHPVNQAPPGVETIMVPTRTSIGPFRSVDLPLHRQFYGADMETMKDVIDFFRDRQDLEIEAVNVGEISDPSVVIQRGHSPNFNLRVKVKERIAFIVAEEVAGRRSSLTTADAAGTVSVFLAGTIDAAEKWMIPRGARRAFRAVAMEALLFVGEINLVKEGVIALYRLSPMEFHRIFSPFLVAIDDQECLENWLASTETLWEKSTTQQRRIRQMSLNSLHWGHKDFANSGDKVKFPTNHADGFHIFRET